MIKPILTVYLSGGISCMDRADARSWRDDAKKVLEDNHLVPICPMTHGVPAARSEEEKSDPKRQAKIFETDCDMIYRADAMLVNMGTISFGTAQEMFYADQMLNIPVFMFNNQGCTSAFMYNTVFHASETLEEAVSAILTTNLQFEGVPHELPWVVATRKDHYRLPEDRLSKEK